MLVGKAFTALAGLLIPALLADHLLTKDEFGAYATAFRLVLISSILGQLGLQHAVVRLVAESLGLGQPGRARQAVRRVYRLAIPGILGVAGILFMGGGAWLATRLWDSPLLAGTMGAVAAWAAVLGLQTLNSETFRGFQDLRLAAVFGGVITGALALLFLTMWWRLQGAASLGQVIWTLVAANAISLSLALAVLRRKLGRLGPATELGRSEVLALSTPLWITGLTTLALMQSDVLILSAFVPATEVAVYFAAAHLVAMVGQPLTMVNLLVPPFIAEFYARGEHERLQRLLRASATLASIPAVIVVAPFLLFGAPILGLIYSDEYRSGATILGLLSVSQLVNVFTGSCGVTMTMTGHQKVLMRITIVTSVLTVAGMLLVVRRYGAVGVASAVCGGILVQNITMWLTTRYVAGLWTHAGVPRLSEMRSLLRSNR